MNGATDQPMIEIRAADSSYSSDWLRMRCELWPDESCDDLRNDIEQFFAGNVRHLQAVLFAHDGSGRMTGFAELNIRAYAEGCITDRVAFLEGWYVQAGDRGKGIGAALIEGAERWARANGCPEFASDALADNDAGIAAHLGVGFESVETVRCFRKRLRND